MIIFYLFLVVQVFAQEAPTAAPGGGEFFRKQVKPIFESRCVQCHSCYNASCQLNLASEEGVRRGMVSGFEIYNAQRLRAVEPSRLGIDRKTIEAWRNFSRSHSFRPVIPDGENSGNSSTSPSSSSLILQSVAHKAANPTQVLNDLSDYNNLAAENSRECPDTSAKLAKFLNKRPNSGMPYGLPALTESELKIIEKWTAQGSPLGDSPSNTTPANTTSAQIAPADLLTARKIEAFFNAFTATADATIAQKKNLVSRYIYEHLFLGHIHLRAEPAPKNFYRLVRSRIPCQEGVDEVATRRPWNDPETKYFYCLKKDDSVLVHKTHMPILVDEKRLDRWNSLFFSMPWNVSFKPSTGFLDRFRSKKGWPQDLAPRSDEEGSNPLHVFRDIPVISRYQFLLDDSAFQVDTFIRGPVCKGNTAVNSIDEQFYVFFVRPESDLMVKNDKFHKAAIPLHVLPAHNGSEQIGGLIAGQKIRNARNNYRVLRDQALGTEFPQGYAITDLWNGNGNADRAGGMAPNRNAGITVVRNFDSSAVKQGLIGATSKTAFLLDYSLFERLVYVLVTGFDVFGDVSHQMQTRIYMSYLRMESEENYLNLFPGPVREAMRKSWYVNSKGITERMSRTVNGLLLREKDKMSRMYPLLGTARPTNVPHKPFDAKKFYAADADYQEEYLRFQRRQVNRMIRNHLGAALAPLPDLNPDKRVIASTPNNFGNIDNLAQFESEFRKLTDLRAIRSPWVLMMPNLSYILVESPEGPEIYTLIRNKEHFNIAWIFGEEGRRNRAADSVMLYKGVIGSYPNQIFVVPIKQAQAFLQGMASLSDHASYEAWIQEFGAVRSGPGSENFWAKSDRIHEVFRLKYPMEYGAFDYNRYGMDYRYHDDESEEGLSALPKTVSDLYKESFGE